MKIVYLFSSLIALMAAADTIDHDMGVGLMVGLAGLLFAVLFVLDGRH